MLGGSLQYQTLVFTLLTVYVAIRFRCSWCRKTGDCGLKSWAFSDCIKSSNSRLSCGTNFCWHLTHFMSKPSNTIIDWPGLVGWIRSASFSSWCCWHLLNMSWFDFSNCCILNCLIINQLAPCHCSIVYSKACFFELNRSRVCLLCSFEQVNLASDPGVAPGEFQQGPLMLPTSS